MWPALYQIHECTKNRGSGHTMVPKFSDEYAIYLDNTGDDHYQVSERNPRRPIRRTQDDFLNETQWEYLTSTGKWHVFPWEAHLKLENAFHLRDIDRKNFITIMQRISGTKKFAKLYTQSKGNLHFDVKFTNFPTKRRSNLQQEVGPEWKLIPSLSSDGTQLLIPPKELMSSDISDYASKFSRSQWVTLFDQIKEKLALLTAQNEKEYWVYTDGFAEDVLHVRFEPLPQRKYKL